MVEIRDRVTAGRPCFFSKAKQVGTSTVFQPLMRDAIGVDVRARSYVCVCECVIYLSVPGPDPGEMSRPGNGLGPKSFKYFV